jgi:hypothetical protein
MAKGVGRPLRQPGARMGRQCERSMLRGPATRQRDTGCSGVSPPLRRRSVERRAIPACEIGPCVIRALIEIQDHVIP